MYKKEITSWNGVHPRRHDDGDCSVDSHRTDPQLASHHCNVFARRYGLPSLVVSASFADSRAKKSPSWSFSRSEIFTSAGGIAGLVLWVLVLEAFYVQIACLPRTPLGQHSVENPWSSLSFSRHNLGSSDMDFSKPFTTTRFRISHSTLVAATFVVMSLALLGCSSEVETAPPVENSDEAPALATEPTNPKSIEAGPTLCSRRCNCPPLETDRSFDASDARSS
jgi:hypothetical protein